MTRRGFTLLETMVAISIFAIIGGALVAVFSRGVDVWEDSRISANFREEPLIFLDGFEREVKNHLNLGDSQFKIGPETISFAAWRDGIYNVEYVFDKSRHSLFKFASRYPMPVASAKAVLVLKNVKKLKFSCEYPKSEGGVEAEASSFPRKVAVSLRLGDELGKREYALGREIDVPVL